MIETVIQFSRHLYSYVSLNVGEIGSFLMAIFWTLSAVWGTFNALFRESNLISFSVSVLYHLHILTTISEHETYWEYFR